MDLLLETTTKLPKEKCWRKRGCPFNSNNSSKYMKCWKENYSVEQCKSDNWEEWKEVI